MPGLRLALVVAAVLGLVSCAGTLPMWFALVGQRPSWEVGDIDTGLIHDGLVATPHFRDTFRWWVGRWAGTVPFYRPLTSYLFWAEWQLFGDHEWRYGFPTAAAHIAATVLFAALAFRLAERWRQRWPTVTAVLAAWGFAGLGLWYRGVIVGTVAGHWKNQPDSWAAICCFAALLAYLRAQEQRKAFPWAAGVWYLAACCFKEAAIPLPLAVLVLELGTLKPERGRAAWRAGTMVGCAGLFLAVRYLALSGSLGYRYGSNNAWLNRTLLELLGPFGMALLMRRWAAVTAGAYALLVGTLWWRMSGRWRRRGGWWPLGSLLLALAIFLVGAAGISLFNLPAGTLAILEGVDFPAQVVMSLILFSTPTYAEEFLLVIVLPFAVWALWRRSPWILCFSVVWTAAFLAPLTMSPGPIHRYYLSGAGYLLAGAVVLSEFATTAAAYLQGWREKRIGRITPAG